MTVCSEIVEFVIITHCTEMTAALIDDLLVRFYLAHPSALNTHFCAFFRCIWLLKGMRHDTLIGLIHVKLKTHLRLIKGLNPSPLSLKTIIGPDIQYRFTKSRHKRIHIKGCSSFVLIVSYVAYYIPYN